MAKHENLTIRLDSTLKRQAEEAAEYLDQTISQVLRFALRRLVIEANAQKKRYESIPHMNPFAMPTPEDGHKLPLHQEHGLGGAIKDATFESFDPARKLQELVNKEKKSFLTKQEREQKKALIRAGVDVLK